MRMTNMLFTGLSLIHYLKGAFFKGQPFLSPAVFYGNLNIIERESLSGDLKVTRNQIFTVEAENLQEAYFIKQPICFTNDRLETIITEARVYKILNKIDPLAKLVPKLIEFDKINYLLITLLMKDMSPLSSSMMKANGSNSAIIAHNFGKILKLFHTELPAAIITCDINYCRFFLFRKPFLLSLSRNEMYRLQFSELDAQNKFAKKLYSYYSTIEGISDSWEKAVLIHGDIKYNNFMIDSNNDLRIVDWEMADIGDPLWDLAGIWSSYIRISEYKKCLELLKIALHAYNNTPTSILIEKLILYTSVNILQKAFYDFENKISNSHSVEWAFSALEEVEYYTKDFL
jgi:thiamine kinase-like enzyme